MALKWSDTQIRLSAKFLNDVNDAVAGGNVAGGSISAAGSLYPLYTGLLGLEIELDNVEALRLSDTAVGTLFGGIYKYVQTLSTAAAAPAVGTPCFYQTAAALLKADGTQYIVTSDSPGATLESVLYAGCFISAPTKGNFCWIQVLGLSTLLIKGTPTSNVVGNTAVLTTTALTYDAVADATAILSGGVPGLKNAWGTWTVAPGASGSPALKTAMVNKRNFFG